jgi:hypothetical protein
MFPAFHSRSCLRTISTFSRDRAVSRGQAGDGGPASLMAAVTATAGFDAMLDRIEPDWREHLRRTP